MSRLKHGVPARPCWQARCLFLHPLPPNRSCALANCDGKALAAQGIIVPLSFQQKRRGEILSPCVQAARFYLKRYTFTQIRHCIHRALLAVANQVVTFAVVVAFTRKSRSIDEVEILM